MESGAERVCMESGCGGVWRVGVGCMERWCGGCMERGCVWRVGEGCMESGRGVYGEWWWEGVYGECGERVYGEWARGCMESG